MARVWFRALLAALIVLVPGCTAVRPSPKLDWFGCVDGFECATLQVPLDHDDPGGARIRLSVIRLPATRDRIGSLLINPGGPGGSGISYARAAPVMLSAEVRERFDIIGFDPRGVGESTPVKCLSDERLDAFLAIDTTPDSADEQRAYDQVSREFAEGCRARSAALLPHVSTTDAARDMDLLRQALGDPQLTYLGKSYGTLLGARYAELFPGKVRAMVLDGALDPAISRVQLNEDQAKGFETAFRTYAAACVKKSSCPFHSKTPEGAQQELSDLLRRTDTKPLTSESGRQVTEALATLGAVTPLYDQASWPTLTEAFREAQNGDGTLLLSNADHLIGRQPDGTYTNQTEASMAVNCTDSPYPTELPQFADAATKAAKLAPRFGPYIMWSSLPCAYWPARPTQPAAPLHAKGAAPILVLGTTRDPATPYPWAESLAAQLESGILLTYDGDGHTAYTSGSTCVDDHVDRYLISLTAPREGIRC